jgi:hypothetical protein
MARNLIKLLNQYDLREKIVAYVKAEGANLNAITTALKSMVNCEVLGLEETFQGTCFGHAFLKHVNMGQLYIFLVNQPSLINKSA